MRLTTFTILLLAVLLAAATVKIFLLFHEKRSLAARLAETETRLHALNQKFDTLRFRLEELQNFRNSMTEAELTTRLQWPRLNLSPGKSPLSSRDASRSSREKYTYIRALSEKGMPGKEIAKILTVSEEEVQQVLALAALTGEGPPDSTSIEKNPA